MKLKIIDSAHHRNGVAGAPFDIVLFKERDLRTGRKVAVLFEEPAYCAVLDVAKLAKGDIAFGSNSWRGDDYEPFLRRTGEPPEVLPPPLQWPTNRSRTVKCTATLAGYSVYTLAENLIDLLTDARHWCDWHGESFSRLDKQAYRHYLAELEQNERIKR